MTVSSKRVDRETWIKRNIELRGVKHSVFEMESKSNEDSKCRSRGAYEFADEFVFDTSELSTIELHLSRNLWIF